MSRGSNPSNSGPNDSPGDSLYASALSEPPLLDLDSTEGEGEGERGEGGAAAVRVAGEGGGKQLEGDRGLAVVEISTLHFYLVSGYRGNLSHDYVCAYVSTYIVVNLQVFYICFVLWFVYQVSQFSLAHTGSLASSGVPLYSTVVNSSHHDSLSKLNLVMQTTPERLQTKPTTLRGRVPPQPPMILVAMDIRLDPERNSKVRYTL